MVTPMCINGHTGVAKVLVDADAEVEARCVRMGVCVCVCGGGGGCRCRCVCMCVWGGWVCHWWLSGLYSGLLIKSLGVPQSSFSIQQCDGYPPTCTIVPTPVHPAVMGTCIYLAFAEGQISLTMSHPSAKGSGGTSGAYTHRLRDLVRPPASF